MCYVQFRKPNLRVIGEIIAAWIAGCLAAAAEVAAGGLHRFPRAAAKLRKLGGAGMESLFERTPLPAQRKLFLIPYEGPVVVLGGDPHRIFGPARTSGDPFLLKEIIGGLAIATRPRNVDVICVLVRTEALIASDTNRELKAWLEEVENDMGNLPLVEADYPPECALAMAAYRPPEDCDAA